MIRLVALMLVAMPWCVSATTVRFGSADLHYYTDSGEHSAALSRMPKSDAIVAILGTEGNVAKLHIATVSPASSTGNISAWVHNERVDALQVARGVFAIDFGKSNSFEIVAEVNNERHVFPFVVRQ